MESPSAGNAEPPPREEGHREDRDWPTDTQVWLWSQSVTFSGFGPAASSLLG